MQQRPGWSWDAHPVILASFSRLLLPLALLVAIFVLLRGHNLPGGGFIAGLITAVALITQYLANGIAWTRPRMSTRLHPMIGIGLLIATATGLASWLFGYPFLTSTFTHVHWPLVGEFELASAMAVRPRRLPRRGRRHPGHPAAASVVCMISTGRSLPPIPRRTTTDGSSDRLPSSVA